MAKICRTCTNSITNNDYFYLDGCSYSLTNLQIHQLLKNCIPEFDFELIPDSVMCKNCISALHVAYYFRQETIKNEERFRINQRIRIKNLEDLKNSLTGTEVIENFDDMKQTFEVELENVNDLKMEFVYDDVGEVNDDIGEVTDEEIVPDTFIEAFENFTDDKNTQEIIETEESASNQENNNFIECPDITPYGDKFKLLENLEYMDLEVSSGNLHNMEMFEMPFDDDSNTQSGTNEQVEKDVASNKTVVKDTDEELTNSLNNISSYIQRTSYSSRKIRNVKRPYKCSECNFRSDAKAGLIIHKRIHTGEKPFHCTLCSYKAKRKAHLEDHMKLHTGERPYTCPACDKSFVTKQILKIHARIHTGETPYKCTQCNYRSRYKTSIKNHISKKHIGEIKVSEIQSSVCYICGKRLSGASSLSTHMKIHTGVKSHLCELCGKHFREKCILNNHLRTHTGEKPFKCVKCDYIATRKAHLILHMKTHVGRSELNECSKCGKWYSTKMLLKKHLRDEHNTLDEVEHFGK